MVHGRNVGAGALLSVDHIAGGDVHRRWLSSPENVIIGIGGSLMKMELMEELLPTAMNTTKKEFLGGPLCLGHCLGALGSALRLVVVVSWPRWW